MALCMRQRQENLQRHCKRQSSSGYSKDDNRPLHIGKKKKVIDIMKDELV